METAPISAPAGLQNPAAVAISGGTVTGTNAPYTLAQSSIPLIGLSSGSVDATGNITGITALPLIYPRAYCYFPANILATVKAAGWYYCTFSSTTAGIAFLDNWTGTSVPTIPSSPTAVTDGKGAFTGDLGEEFGPQITLPAGALGINGQIEWAFNISNTSNANAKTYRGRFSGTAGTIVLAPGGASNASFGHTYVTQNAGIATAQNTGGIGGNPVTLSAPTLSAIDTTAATTLVLSAQRATATDNAIFTSWRLRVAYSA